MIYGNTEYNYTYTPNVITSPSYHHKSVCIRKSYAKLYKEKNDSVANIKKRPICAWGLDCTETIFLYLKLTIIISIR